MELPIEMTQKRFSKASPWQALLGSCANWATSPSKFLYWVFALRSDVLLISGVLTECGYSWR